MLDGMVPTSLALPSTMRSIDPIGHDIPVHEHTGTIGSPRVQAQPDVNVDLTVRAAAKSHIARPSAPTVGENVGETVGHAVVGEAVVGASVGCDGRPVGTPVGTPMG